MSRRGDNLIRPPRQVPFSLTCHLLFGGFLNQFGWCFFSFGMLFVLVFCQNMDFSDQTRFRGQLGTAPGAVTGVEKTNMSVNEEDVVGWVFEYQVDGQTFQGISYTDGWDHDEGDKVTVEFPSADPGCARIVGSRRSQAPPFLLIFLVIFPAVGFFLWSYGFRGGIKGCRLLARGVLGRGRLLSKERTNTTINDNPVYELTFAFAPEGYTREFQCKARSHLPESLEDEAEEPLLYSPSDPNDAVMLDSLPGGGAITPGGNLQSKGLLATLALLIGPALGLLFTILTIVTLAT